MKIFFSKLLRFIGVYCLRAAKILSQKKSILEIHGNSRSQYRLPSGAVMLLNQEGYIDSQIINYGVFEPQSTDLVYKLVMPGDVVFDIGANIGYYTIIFSKLVGNGGKVYAFEPTKHYREILNTNLGLNNAQNVEVIDEGLSDSKRTAVIDIGPSSATLHSPEGYDKVVGHEPIKLSTLKDFVLYHEIERINFIKIDIDGHEPHFFDGAWEILDQFDVVILFEISHLHYLEAGVTAWDFYQKLFDRKYNIYHEISLRKITSRNDFLMSCADFSTSCNVVITKKELSV